MPSYPSIPSLEVIDAILSKTYHLLKITEFCSILQQPDLCLKKKQFEMNLEWPTSLNTKCGSDCCNTCDVIPFAAKILICSILQQPGGFCERNLSESIQNT